ncbi:MAG: UrcA family protein [Sphingomonas sp.]
MMIRNMMFAAAAAAFASAASGSPGSVYLDKTDRAHVPYGDVDLNSPDGRAELRGRIRIAAGLVCAAAPEDTALESVRTSCLRAAVASGVSQMNRLAAR